MMAELGLSWSSDMPTFWRAIAKKAAPDGKYNTVCETIGESLIDEMVLTTDQMMTKMTDVQIKRILITSGAKETWMSMVEFVTGSQFTMAHPASAQLALTTLNPNVHGWHGRASKFDRCSIGAQMSAAGTLKDERLPDFIFDAALECEDPRNQALTSNDITAVLNMYDAFVVVKHGTLGVDAPLRRRHAAILKERLPHFSKYGETSAVARCWYKMLQERKRNIRRTDSKVRATPPAHCPRVPTSQATLHTCCHTRSQVTSNPIAWPSTALWPCPSGCHTRGPVPRSLPSTSPTAGGLVNAHGRRPA